jgi:two-component system, OmpR family, response regulator
MLERILYVEDQPDIQMIARMALERVGKLTLRVCSSGQEALAHAEAFAPDLLLLDVMMPDMDGPETLRRLRLLDAFKSTPAIFMTAKVRAEDVAQLRAAGAIDVIAKPFDPMTLAQTIRAMWQRATGAG